MSFIITTVTPVLLTLQALLITLAVVGTLRNPERSASLYAPAPTESAGAGTRLASVDVSFVSFMVPLQASVAWLMFHAAALLWGGTASASDAAALLGAFALMEAGFVLVRVRTNARRGSSPWWRFPAGNRLASLPACIMSTVLASVYGLCATVLTLRAS